jgi:hypothetical protein
MFDASLLASEECIASIFRVMKCKQSDQQQASGSFS